jgi:RNA polymerase sigma-70 factor (ECF subfamily)
MGALMTDEPGETEDLLVRAASGDREALAALWERHRKRLRQMVRLRLDRRLQGRVDPSDVLREAYIDMAERLPEYVRDRAFTTYLWLRLVTGLSKTATNNRYMRALSHLRDLLESIPGFLE